jgi:hypothetical protein
LQHRQTKASGTGAVSQAGSGKINPPSPNAAPTQAALCAAQAASQLVDSVLPTVAGKQDSPALGGADGVTAQPHSKANPAKARVILPFLKRGEITSV